MAASGLDFERDGACHFGGAMTPTAAAMLAQCLSCDIDGQPGRRLMVEPDVETLLSSSGAVGRIAAALVGENARPVRAVLFDKTQAANWIVAWHQDRTIAVRERHEVAGYGPWSLKDGCPHVAPPIEVLAGMATLRLHLDSCDVENAPLKVALGSHHLGRVAATDAADNAGRHRLLTCHAAAGDVWAYSTPILHTSARTISDRRRRVLQIDYAAYDLPPPLEWLGIRRL